MDKERVLHIVGTMNLGGQETFIMNLYRNINRSEIQFDFIVHSLEKGAFDDEIKQLGGRIYRITPISKNIIKHCKELKKIMTQGKYIAVHRHTSSAFVFIDLMIAKFSGIKTRIVHSHNTSTENRMLHKLCQPFLNRFANVKLACGKEAGEWLFGRKEKYEVINNGIDIEKYEFNEKERKNIRRKINAENRKVIGHIGRFSKQKNHKFLIKVFSEIIKKDKSFLLLLIGDGELKNAIEEKVKELKIENNVLFLGTRKDVNKILNAIDLIIFPSLYEGIPVAMVEAQANGVPIFMSNNISEKVIYNSNVKAINLSEEEWVDSIINSNFERVDVSKKLIQEYSIKKIVEKMQKIYL